MLNLVHHFIRQQPDRCTFLAHHYPRLRLKKTWKLVGDSKEPIHNITTLTQKRKPYAAVEKDIHGRRSFADFFDKPFSLVFIAYICNSLINVLTIAWLQYQTAQPLWPTRLEKGYQDPRNMHMIFYFFLKKIKVL